MTEPVVPDPDQSSDVRPPSRSLAPSSTALIAEYPHQRLAISALLLLYLLIWCFWFLPVVLGDQIFFFRDAATWHLPWLEWTTTQWSLGNWPLWNPEVGLGVNWVGQGTSTVFYPGTWLLCVLPGSFRSRYGLLLGLHILLAAFNGYVAARRTGMTPLTSVLTGITYSWSGPVLIQTCNWPFLVSAAWLPLASLGLFDAMRGQPGAWIVAAMALSLMVLGGDPQTVYTLLLAGLCGFLLTRFQSSGRTETAAGPFFSRAVSGWLLTGVAVVACSLVQLAASFDAAQKSVRALDQKQVAQSPSSLISAEEQSLEDLVASVGLEERQILRFSQPPWTLATLFSGNVLGTWRDYNRRWDQLLPAAEQPWSPTLYVGTGTLLLAFLSVWVVSERDSQRRRLVRWLQILILFSGLASFGWYGLGWLGLEAGWQSRQEPAALAPQVGGLYWILQQCIPFYDQFRYPGKLWQIAGWGICLLAGLQWEAVERDTTDRMRQRLIFVLMFTMLIFMLLFGLTLHSWSYETLIRWFSVGHVDPWLGYLRPELAVAEVQMALFQTLAVSSLLWLLLISGQLPDQSPLRQILPPMSVTFRHGFIVGLVMADLAIANGWQLGTTHQDCIAARAMSVTKLVENEGQPSIRYYFLDETFQRHRQLEMQRKWGNSSAGRPVEKLAWQTLRSMTVSEFPQLHLRLPNVGVVNADCTLRPAYRDLVDQIARRHMADLPPDLRAQAWQNYLIRLGVTHWSGPEHVRISDDSDNTRVLVQPLPETLSGNSPQLAGRAGWVADRWTVRPRPPLSTVPGLEDLVEIWTEIIRNDAPTNSVVLDDAPEVMLQPGGKATESPDLIVDLPQSAVVYFPMTYDEGWCAWTTEGHAQPVRVNRWLLGFALPAGQHQIRLIYQPWWWRWGAPLTAISWLVLFAAAGYIQRSRPRAVNAASDKVDAAASQDH